MKRTTLLFASALAIGLTQPGCLVKTTDTDKFREGIPTSQDVELKEPSASSGSGTQATVPGFRAEGVPGGDAYAKYYRFTRAMFDGVNWGTAYILGTVWFIVHLPPTSVTDKEATWGPGSEALQPAEYRFRATEVATGEFDYTLEGRAKNLGSIAPYLPVLSGKGYGKAHPKHRQGWFEINHDNANKLDPARPHADDESGTAKVTYTLDAFPITIVADFHKSATPDYATVTVTTQKDGGGRVDIDARADIDDLKTTKLEDVAMRSRWLSTGAGRADVLIANGDIPANLSPVKLSECWSTSFVRVYYTDTASLEPTTGTESQCAFQGAEF